MRKILFILFILLVDFVYSQDIKPIDPINFKNLQSPSFSFYAIDSSVWIYKGSTLGWSKLATANQYLRKWNDSIDFIKFTKKNPPQYLPYIIFADTANHSISYYNDENDISMQIGFENWTRVYNGSGVDILNGRIVRSDFSHAGYPSIMLADNRYFYTADNVLGFATHDIPSGSFGYVTTSGEVRDVETNGASSGDIIYLGQNGLPTHIRPTHPNYVVEVGQCLFADPVTGKLLVKLNGNVNDIMLNILNNTFVEGFDFTVSSNGTTVKGLLQRKGGNGDLTMFFNGSFSTLDCTPALEVILTPGTSTLPMRNRIYILESDKQVHVSTSGWPSESHLRVADVLLRTASQTATEGVLKNQIWNDHAAELDGVGHIFHINSRIRRLPADWYSGVEPSVVIQTASNPDNVYFNTTAGKVYQMHLQNFPAQNMPTDDIHIANHPLSKFLTINNLNQILIDAENNSLVNRSFSLVIWGIQNEQNEKSHLMVNLPRNSYNNNSDAKNDPLNYSIYDIPREFLGSGFLIARLTFSHSSANGGSWALEQIQDLRGFTPNTTAGGGASGTGGGVTSFLQLTDTPSSYNTFGGRIVGVNSEETGLTFYRLQNSKVGNNVTIGLPLGTNTTFSVADADSSITNELQNLSSIRNGNDVTVNISNGTGTIFNIADNDNDSANELNTSMTWDEPTNTISITDAGGNKSTQITGFAKSTDISNVVTASTAFGNDNRLLRSDGTGRGSQSSGITVDDSNNITGIVTLVASNRLRSTYLSSYSYLTDLNTSQVIYGGLIGILSADFQPLNRPSEGNYFNGFEFNPLHTNNGYKGQFGVTSSGSELNAFQVRVANSIGEWSPWRRILHSGNFISGTDYLPPHSVTNNYLLKSNGLGGISQSVIFDNGTNVGIGTNSPSSIFHLKTPSPATITLEQTSTTPALISQKWSGSGSIDILNLGFSGNTDILSILEDGRVGAGTNNPSGKLQVINSIASTPTIVATNNASSGFIFPMFLQAPNMEDGSTLAFTIGKSSSINNRVTFAYNHISDGNSNNRYSVSFYGAENLFNVLASGNVGIMTTTPSSKLQVYGTSGRVAVFGDVGASTQAATPVNVSFGSTYGNSAPGSVNNLKWDLFTSASSGSRYGIGMSANLMEFQSGPNGGLGFFVNQGAEAMRILSSGSVGIGTTNPLEKLDVNGNIKSSSLSGVGTRLVTANSSGVLGSIDYNYINLNSFSSGTATSGQVPTANGSGGITWANQSGSGGYWSQSSGAIYPTTITDEVRIGSTTDLGSQKLQVDANSVFRLRNVNTTQSIDFITAVTGTQPYFRLEHDGNSGLQIAGYKDSYWSSIFSIKYPSFVSYFSTAIKLGTTSLEEAGVMRYNGTNFQGYNGTTWVNLDGSGTSQWTNDTYGINYLSNIGVGTTSTSGVKLSAYQNGTGYVASLVNQSSSGSGLWLSGGGDATYSLEVNNYAGSPRFRILGSGRVFSYGLTNSTSSNVLYYNSSTGEISYGAATGGTSQWVNDTYGINYTSGNVSVGAASSSSVKFKSSLNTADAYAGSFENSNASGNGLYIRGGYTNRYALAVDDYNTADLFSIMGDGKIYANKLTNSSTSYTLYYNTSTKEISYALAPSGGGGDYWLKSSGVIFPTTTTDKLVIGKTTSSGEAMFEVQGKSAFSDEISVGTRLWMGGGSVVLNNAPGQLLLSTNMSTENDIALSVRSSVYNPSGSLFRVRGNGYIDIAFNDNSPTVYTASSGVLRAGSNGKLYWKTISGGEYDLTATGSGGGTPGGSINSIQYNNSGTFGGFGNVGTYTISLGKPLELENRLNHPSATGQGIVTYDYIEDRVYVGTYGAQMPINRQKTQTPTIATNMTLDWRNGANMSITLTTNVALSIQNIPDGESGTILVKQDATGNRNISFTVWADSGLNSLTQTKIGSITDINKVSNKYSTITYKRFAGVVTLVYGREN